MFAAFVDPHWAVMSRVFDVVVSNVVVLIVLKSSPSNAFDASFEYVNSPATAIDAVPAAPIWRIVKTMRRSKCFTVVRGSVMRSLSPSITDPDFTLIRIVSLLAELIIPVIDAKKLSPIENAFAGSDSVPTPPSINERSEVVAVIGVLLAV